MGIRWRFVAAYLMLALIGLGSMLFHGTLRYEWQLLDEVPMLFIICHFIYCLYASYLPGRLCRNQWSRGTLWLTIGVPLVTSWLYHRSGNPLVHQLAFGFCTFIVAVQSYTRLLLCRSVTDVVGIVEGRSKGSRLVVGVSTTFLAAGSAILILAGFVLWNIDNLACGALHRFRTPLALLPPSLLDAKAGEKAGSARMTATLFIVGALTQMHAWWHVLSLLSTMWAINGMLLHHYTEQLQVGDGYKRATATLMVPVVQMRWAVLPVFSLHPIDISNRGSAKLE